MALRNHPQLRTQTVERVNKAACEMGYVPDPQLSKIATQRWKNDAVSSVSNLAFVETVHPRYVEFLPQEAVERLMGFLYDPHHSPAWVKYLSGFYQFQGARKRASELGYHLDYHLYFPGDDIQSLSERLYHKGVDGVLLSSIFSRQFIMDFRWGDFSTLALGDHGLLPPVDFVVPRLSSNIAEVLERIRNSGYRRPGLVMDWMKCQHLANHVLKGVFLSLCESMSFVFSKSSVCYIDAQYANSIKDWVEAVSPDVIIGFSDLVYEVLTVHGYRIPGDFAFVSLSTQKKSDSLISGLNDADWVVGYEGVNYLNHRIRMGVKGSVDRRTFHCVETKWTDGDTLPCIHPYDSQRVCRIG